METSTHVGDVDSGGGLNEAAAILEARYGQDPQYGPVETEAKPEVEPVEIDEPTEVIEEEAVSQDDEEVPVEADATTEKEETFKSVSELAEATGMELEDFLNTINLKTKVNGEESEVSLSTLVKGYQLEQDYTRKSQEHASNIKAFEESQAKAQAEITAEVQKAGQMVGLAQQHLTDEFNGVDWTALQASDPTQYVIKRQQFGERQAQINQMIEAGTAQAKALYDKQTEDTNAQNLKHLEEQDGLLVAAIPEWTDTATRRKGEEEITDFLIKFGFDEGVSFPDHRLILLARQAMKADKIDQGVDKALKKVAQAPKLLKPGAKSQVNAQQQTTAKLVKKVKQTGSLDAVSQLLMAREK